MIVHELTPADRSKPRNSEPGKKAKSRVSKKILQGLYGWKEGKSANTTLAKQGKRTTNIDDVISYIKDNKHRIK